MEKQKSAVLVAHTLKSVRVKDFALPAFSKVLVLAWQDDVFRLVRVKIGEWVGWIDYDHAPLDVSFDCIKAKLKKF